MTYFYYSIWRFISDKKGIPQFANWVISLQKYFSAKSPLFKSILKNGSFNGYVILVLNFFPIGIIKNFIGTESVVNIFARLK